MGIDLMFLVCDGWFDASTGQAKAWGYAHTILNLPRNYYLHEEINKLGDGEPIPPDFSSYVARQHVPGCEETGYGNMAKDPYGQPLRAHTAGALRSFEIKPEWGRKVAAAFAYLAALDPSTRVVLYWH